MYIPKQFEELRTEIMHDLIRAHPLATLITLKDGNIEANHIPMVLASSDGLFGTLRGHIARSNLICNEHPKEADVLAIFHGAESYITPSWYASKAESGKVVPTWNYVTVHAKGKLRVIEDPIWIRSQLESLTSINEAGFEHPWAVSDAPGEFTAKLIEAIIGFEIVISKLQGKWKVSQNRTAHDRDSLSKGLSNHGDFEMAKLVKN
jgi:transcriptional regulator